MAVDLFGQEEIEMTVRTRWSVMKLCGELSKRTGVPDTLLEVSKMSKGEMEAEELMFPGLTLSR